MDKVYNVATAIVGVALIATLVTNSNTAPVITAVGNAFASSIRAAMGKV